MKKTIYTKYANDRAEMFALRTDIVKDADGTRYVRKCFLNEAGKAHVLEMYKNYKVLMDAYKGYAVPVVPVACRAIENGVEFDFIKGASLDAVLKEQIVQNDSEKLKELLKQYLEMVSFDHTDECFASSPEFETVFGEIGAEWEQEKAVSYANIDMIPGNIIINDKWNVIDYEWMFDFKIPAKFVKYRCLHYWFHESRGKTLLSWDELLELIEVTKEQQTVFEQMERHFQKYLCEGIVPTREMREIIGQNIVTINEVNEELLKMQPVQIYYDTGNDFNEKESCKIKKANFADHKCAFQWEIPADIKAIRIDPIEKVCVCAIRQFKINGADVEFITNGIKISENTYNFETSDPWFISYVEAKKGDVLEVEIEMDSEAYACKALSESHTELVRLEEKQVILQNEKLAADHAKNILQQEKAAVEHANQVLHQEKAAVEHANQVLQQEKTAVEHANQVLHQENVRLNETVYRLDAENTHMSNENAFLLDQFEQSQMQMADKMMKKQKAKNVLRGKWFG